MIIWKFILSARLCYITIIAIKVFIDASLQWRHQVFPRGGTFEEKM